VCIPAKRCREVINRTVTDQQQTTPPTNGDLEIWRYGDMEMDGDMEIWRYGDGWRCGDMEIWRYGDGWRYGDIQIWMETWNMGICGYGWRYGDLIWMEIGR
jgi:hypothetical protein